MQAAASGPTSLAAADVSSRRRLHVFDELRCSLGLRKHSRAAMAKRRRRDDAPPQFFPSTQGWRDVAPPETMSAWKTGPTQVLESLVGAPTLSLNVSQYYPGASACSDAVEAQLRLLHAAVLAEGGLLPTAMAIAAERG